ncbi:branched-chain amino acid ABC transporter permease [Candidatus Acetothermia bacterium]|nr:branched-chain amino acid ABC transporter permease [Candidatus Acetothermia bacterium]MBI3644115.1 branched-chain amino acid ABC transporter permease [Candidatus Acetothermia bacterium]
MLGAIGLTLTYKILNFANFAHGDILIFGAYIAFSVDGLMVDSLPQLFPILADPANDDLLRLIALFIAMISAVFGAIGFALLIDRILYRRLRRSASVVLVIASFGMALFIRALVQAVWGVATHTYSVRVTLPMYVDAFGIFQFRMTLLQLVTITTAFTLIILLHLFLRYTRTGKAMRAMSDNMDLARVSGINTEKMIRWTWGIGSGLAAVAGVFAGLNLGGLTPIQGSDILLYLFAAVILGGIGSPYGAMLGALVIGIAQTILIAPVTTISSQYKPGIAFLLLIIMLLVRPQGLLGSAGRKG